MRKKKPSFPIYRHSASQDTHYRRKYNITAETYEVMLEEQEYRCGICRVHLSNIEGKFHVDHCHDTGKVRGLLCRKCNHGLAMFQDSIPILARAILYLEDNCENDGSEKE